MPTPPTSTLRLPPDPGRRVGVAQELPGLGGEPQGLPVARELHRARAARRQDAAVRGARGGAAADRTIDEQNVLDAYAQYLRRLRRGRQRSPSPGRLPRGRTDAARGRDVLHLFGVDVRRPADATTTGRREPARQRARPEPARPVDAVAPMDVQIRAARRRPVVHWGACTSSGPSIKTRTEQQGGDGGSRVRRLPAQDGDEVHDAAARRPWTAPRPSSCRPTFWPAARGDSRRLAADHRDPR